MRTSIKMSYCLFILFAFPACRSIYTPTTPNTPLFRSGNQFQTEVTGCFNGLNLKTAYTPVNHLAFQVNGQYGQELDQKNPDRKYHRYLEGAVGAYHCFNNNWVIELYSGYGQGSSIFGDGLTANETLLTWAKGHYEKYYVQLNVGSHKLLNNGRIGACIRVVNVRYTYTDSNFRWLINTTADHTSIEPYAFINLNIGKRVAFVSSLGLTFIQGLSNVPYQATMRTSVINAGVGFKVTIGNVD